MTQIIDRRRGNRNKSAVNRQRFIRRYKSQIKRAVSDAIAKRSITNIDNGEQITIVNKDINEPYFHHGKGGANEQVFPGNNDFLTGDRIKRPKSGGQKNGENASNQGEGDDDFIFELSREEFLDLYFEDLELPDLIKKQIAKMMSTSYVRSGITSSGTPTNINIIRSMKQATSRRLALSGPHRRQLADAKEQLKELLLVKTEDDDEVIKLKEHIAKLKNKIDSFPFIDTMDLRYNNRIQQQRPTTRAVMFCIMDVSGSMDETKKDIAKRFFILLYLFLTKTYEKIDLVFIRHHTSAKEVGEEEFFYSRETGGTVVSSALEMMSQIMHQRYPSSTWNIYAAQASDGDNWNADSPYCQKILLEGIMPHVQYYAYTEIMPRHHQSLWEAYLTIADQYPHFAMQTITKLSDIYPVFRELFKRQSA